ncbi:MAG TPA: TonB family protein [Kofleriaceae bacterium]|nr:TonB family protein [Kofleriaceae bacterium]
MARRKFLVGISIFGHAALLAGVVLHGAWGLDRLDYEHRSRLTLGAMAPPAAEGGTINLPKVDMKPKEAPKVVVKEPRQPRKIDDRKPPTTQSLEPGTGQTTGPGRDGPGDTDGPCRPEDGDCATAPPAVPPPPELPKTPEVPPPPKPVLVAPQILKGLRTSGETAIHPPRDVYNQMARDGEYKTGAVLKVCITTTGAISSVAVAKSTGYPAYDEALVGAARRWAYRPYTVDGRPVPVCSAVTFLYQMK